MLILIRRCHHLCGKNREGFRAVKYKRGNCFHATDKSILHKVDTVKFNLKSMYGINI